MTVLMSPAVLAGCGESASEKATKQVCSATSEISAQVKKIENLPISSHFPAELKTGAEAIEANIKKISEAAPNLPTARKEETNAAKKTFQVELAKITAQVVSATRSSNLEAALKSAEPQIKASLSKISAAYKKAFEELKCS